MKIAVDMDGVMADALGEHLLRYNRLFGTDLKREAFIGRNFTEVIPAEHVRAAIDMVHTHDFFADLEVMPGALEVLKRLHDEHEIFIATAAMEVPNSFAAKFQWLQRHFSFISPMNYVFCGAKHIIAADYLIDDTPHHFKKFSGRGILFDAPHNRHVVGHRRANNWHEVEAILLQDKVSPVAT